MAKIPNWCNAFIKVRGKSKDIENFCKLFVFEENVGDKEGKYFARSFVHCSWDFFKKEHLGKNKAEFTINFAWSGWSCLIKGYPQEIEECVTLEWACKKYNVEVEITTEEQGCGFEETIVYTKKKGLRYECNDMATYVCKCGVETMFPTDCEIEQEECGECGKYGEWKLKKENKK